MTDGLEDIAFLARSPNRLAVLEAVCEGPRTRRELEEAVDVSRVTASRVLEGLQSRGWVTASGDAYEASPVGCLVHEDLLALRDTVAAGRELGVVLEHLPPSALDVDVRHLLDARVTVPSPENPLATFDRAVSRVREAPEIRLLSNVTAPENFRAVHQRVVADGVDFEAVLQRSVVETLLADDEMRRLLADVLACENARVHCLDDDLPCVVAVLGDSVDIAVSDEDGLPRALLESDRAAVVDWGEATFQRYRDHATPITAADVSSVDE